MPRVLLDTNLLLLFVIGAIDPGRVLRHKRTQKYSLRDLDVLKLYIQQNGDALVLCPNVVTEASNHLSPDQTGELAATLHAVVAGAEERGIASADAMKRSEYLWLGVADAVLLTLCQEDAVLLTDDGPLHSAALSAGLPARYFAEI